MKMVNQWKMAQLSRYIFSVFVVGSISSCNVTEAPKAKLSGQLDGSDGSRINKAFVYLDSPSIILGSKANPNLPNIKETLHYAPMLITENTQLTGNCHFNTTFNFNNFNYNVSNCIRSLSDNENLNLLTRQPDNSWIFPIDSKEFYQTNTLFHLQNGINKFFDKMQFAYNYVHNTGQSTPKAIPPYLGTSKMFWFNGVSNTDSQLFRNEFLTSYSQCNFDNNAFFSPAGPELCFGKHTGYANFLFAQDPSIIYHELAHALVSVMMNFRNGTNSGTHNFRSALGSYGYNEASSINEGIADYFSFVMNKRKHVGEWSLGKTKSPQSRPLDEDGDLHISALSTTSEGRLSYPHYLLYDPNYPESPLEDVHYAGMITTHYLVALTEKLKSSCGLESENDGGHETSTSFVMLILSETLAELGDLNAKGIDAFGAPFTSNLFFKNLDSMSSFLWAHDINPPTFRSFSQLFAKNINKYISKQPFGLCPSFTKYESEKLLDDYGLLLFKDYNDKGVSTKDRSRTYSHAVPSIPQQSLTIVSESTRRKSVLVSKDLLTLAEPTNTRKDIFTYYIIDSQADMKALLKDLLFKGLSVPLSNTDVADVEFNNNNVAISPGEIVGIIPNLHNSSNSTIAGVQVLATDWDHTHIENTHNGNFKPCVFDNATTVDQGGIKGASCDNQTGHVYPDKEYKKLVRGQNGLFPTNAAAPVCFVEVTDNETTKWVSQNEYRQRNGNTLTDNKCLGYATSGVTDTDFSFNPHECLARFLPGASTAYFSRIDPQSNYYDSVVKNSDSKEFNAGNLLIMEVNKWVKPGTKFRCRLRARFSNCSDCFNDPESNNEEYLDSDLNGHKPFKILNFDFTVYE